MAVKKEKSTAQKVKEYQKVVAEKNTEASKIDFNRSGITIFNGEEV